MTAPASSTTSTAADTGPQHDGNAADSSLAGNLSWSVLGEAVRLVSSFAAFLILVRVYRPGDLGRLVAATSLSAALFPLASVGSGWLVLHRVTKDRWRPERALAVASGLTLLGSVAIGSLLVVLRPLILPQMPLLAFVGAVMSDMVLLGLVEVTLFAAQASERMVAKAVAWTAYGLGRAAAAVIVWAATDDPGLEVWIGATLVVGSLALVTAQYMTVGRLVRPRLPSLLDVRHGIPYSVGFGAERFLATTDNVLLVRLDFTEDAGLYAAARRLLTVSLAPCMAALHAVSARLWRAGAQSVMEARNLALGFTGWGVVYGLGSLVGWLVLGDAITLLLGDNYAASAEILPWLSVLPLLTVLEIFAATALTGSGLHHQRVVLTVAVGLCNVALNLAWIPSAGWRGAVYASLVSSLVLVALLWGALLRATRGSHG